MRISTGLAIAGLLALSACSQMGKQPVFAEEDPARIAEHEAIIAKAPHPNLIGTEEWYVWVEEAAGITDGHGGGPDHGSTEWNHAVQRKVMGFEPDESMSFDKSWQRQVDRAIRENRSIFKVF